MVGLPVPPFLFLTSKDWKSARERRRRKQGRQSRSVSYHSVLVSIYLCMSKMVIKPLLTLFCAAKPSPDVRFARRLEAATCAASRTIGCRPASCRVASCAEQIPKRA